MSVNPVSAEVSAPGTALGQRDEWRRLSPRMLLVHPVKEVGRVLPGLVALLLAGSSAGHGGLWGLAGAVVVSLLSLSRWFTTRYRVSAEQVQIREGLLRRRTVAARLDRVRTVDVTSHALHRALGLARVEIGTGVSDRKGSSILKLDGLPASQAARLRGELLHRSAAATGTTAAGGTPPQEAVDVDRSRPAVGDIGQETEIARLRPGWIRFAPFTLSGAFTGLAIAGFGWRIVSEGQVDVGKVGPLHSLAAHLNSSPLWVALLEVVVAGVVFIAAASTGGYVLSYWNFRISRHSGGSFQVSRGLLTTRATSIDVSRLRGVSISETFLMRLVGGARTVAIATGLHAGRGAPAARSGTVLLPDAPLADARHVAAVVLGSPDLVSTRLVGHGATARRRRFTRAIGGAAGLAAATALAWRALAPGGSGWLLALVLIPLAVPLAADRARNLGHLVRGGLLATQSGSLVRRRAVISTDAVIGWNLRQSIFQRRGGVATLVATTAAGHQSYRLVDLPLPVARQVADQVLPGLLAEFTSP